MEINALYSLENAQRYRWSSVTGQLNPERVMHLDTFLVGSAILDAGCGGGAYVEYLSGKGLDVMGCDKYPEFLELAKANDRPDRYVEADILNLKFTENQFDSTYCFDVLEHVDDQVAIQELARVTKQRLILAVPKHDEVMHRFSLTFFHYSDQTHLRTYTEDSLRQLTAVVRPVRVAIYPELAVPTRELVAELLDLDAPPPPRATPIKRLQRRLLDKLLANALYRFVPTGLIAVVDLS